MSNTVTAFTDGACRGNPGPGGWGVVLRWRERDRRIYGSEANTTNNRMELTAAIRALEALTRPSRVRLHSDSTYLCKGVNEWLSRWRARGWRTADGKPVKNADLWQRLAELLAQHQVECIWVKAHAGIPDNELADQLANQGIDELLKNPLRATS